MTFAQEQAPPGFWRQTWNGLSLVFGRRASGAVLLAFLLGWLGLALYGPATSWLERLLRDGAQSLGMGLREPAPNLAIVAIDADTLESVPYRWPWPRTEFARLLSLLAEGRPRFIVFDVLLQHLDGEKPSEADEELATTMRRLGNIALVSIVEETLTPLGTEVRHFRNHVLFRGAAQLEGFVWGVIDPDSRIRSFVLRDGRLGLESCVSQVAHRLQPEVRLWEGWWGEVVQCPIAFASKGGGIPVISAGDLLKREVPVGVLRDKIVLVGVSAPILHDHHRTGAGIIAGVNVLAAELDTLLSGRGGLIFDSQTARFAMAFLGLFLGLGTMSAGGRLVALSSVAGLCGVVGAILLVGEWWFVQFPVGTLAASWAYVWLVGLGLGGFLEFLHSQFAKVEALAAAQVQEQIFPAGEWSSVTGYRCRGVCFPSDETGGDYFDFVPLEDGSLFFLIGDVSGHGFSAAMVTTMAKTITQVLTQEGRLNPEEAHAMFGTTLGHLLKRKKMMTMVIGHIDVRSNELNIVFAGHLPPLLIGKDGVLLEIGAPSMPFGFPDKPPLRSTKVPFPAGASLVLYTDGITEAMSWDGKQYGFDRWYSHLAKLMPTFPWGGDPSGLLEDVRGFVGGRHFGDDVTVLLIQRQG